MSLDRHEDLAAITRLLDQELPDRRFVDEAYLSWLYDGNPHGPSFHLTAIDDGEKGNRELLAHYAVVAQDYRDRAGRHRMVFSLNAVTSSTSQRKGWFSTIGQEIYEQAREWGAAGVVAVANAKSTPGAVKYLGYEVLGPMPVRLLVAVPRHREGWSSHRVDRGFIGSPVWDDAVDGLDDAPVTGWVNCWTPRQLAWRLSAPNCGPYAIHVGPDLVAVSTIDHAGPVPVAVVLKLLPRKGWVDGGSARPALEAICAHHRTPVAVWAGINRRVRVRGLATPTRLQPSPLNLLFRSLGERAPGDRFSLDVFEFGDFDAY